MNQNIMAGFFSRFVALFLFVAILSSCSYVSSQNPIGLMSYQLKTNDWNGTWLNEDGMVKINVIDEPNGIVEIAWIEKKEQKLHFESVKAKIMKGKKWLYANVLNETNDQHKSHYFWVKLRKVTDKIVLWPPSVAAFKAAAETKKIKAVVNKKSSIDGTRELTDNIQLLDTSENIVDLLENNGSKYFSWEEPLTLIRIND